MIALISSLLGVFGAGLGSLFSWAVSYFQQREREKADAANQMDLDIAAHAADGQISVGDMESAESQLDNLKVQAEQIDLSTVPTSGGKP